MRDCVMSRFQLQAWELAGLIFILIVGIPLHSVFAWSGHSLFVGWLAPVNESTWEHFKLCFWPGAAFSLIECCAVSEIPRSFWIAKTTGLLSMPVAIMVLFYGYTAVLGHHVLFADILVFVLAVAIGQSISCWMLMSGPVASHWWGTGILFMALAVVWFTYDPPHVFLFRDPTTLRYGIAHD